MLLVLLARYKGDTVMVTKKCTKCGETKKLSEFTKNKSSCKMCTKVYKRIYDEKNKDKTKVHYKENKDEIKASNKAWKAKNKDKVKSYNKVYKTKNKDKRNTYQRNRLIEDPIYKLTRNLRRRLYNAIKDNYKKGSAIKDLGCTLDECKQHIESLFKPGMTWNNWTYDGWHLDHIIPLSSFNLEDREQFLQAHHYTNLQPLWAKDNMTKGNRLDWSTEE